MSLFCKIRQHIIFAVLSTLVFSMGMPIAQADDLSTYFKFIKQITDKGYHDSDSQDFTLDFVSNHNEDYGEFSIVIYNIRGFPDALDGITNTESKQVGSFIEQWGENGVDIVVLQEDWVKHGKVIKNITSTTFPYRTKHYDGGLITLGDGLATLSRFPFDDNWAKREPFDECHGTLLEAIQGTVSSPDCQAEKGFTLVRMVVDNEFELDVYNLHQNTAWLYDTNSPNMKQFAEYINEKSEGRPVLIGGDWNSNVENNPHKTYTEGDKYNWRDRSEWIQEIMDATGISFACVDIPHQLDPEIADTVDEFVEYDKCNRDVIGYRGTESITLTPVSRLRLEDDNISGGHEPELVTFQWSRNEEDLSQVEDSTSVAVDGVDSSSGGGSLDFTYTLLLLSGFGVRYRQLR